MAQTDRRRPTPEERFWAKVDARGDCWEWTASHNSDGYGNFRPEPGKCVNAHRFAYELLVGPVPDGLVLDHLCRNRGCLNPDHLEPVTRSVNKMRSPIRTIPPAVQRWESGYCGRGHALTPDNVGIQKSGRYCKVCDRANAKRRYEAQKAAR